jgi:uncharacterized protein YegL
MMSPQPLPSLPVDVSRFVTRPADVAKYATPRRTYIALVLDSSGSMADVIDATISGFNEQVETISKQSKQFGESTFVSLVTFNSEVFELYSNVSPDSVQKLTKENYRPDGMTRMYDAVGYTIERLARDTNAQDENNAYLVVIMSDGIENYSKHFNAYMLADRIKRLQATNRWTFTYIGANQDLSKVRQDLGLMAGNMASYKNTHRGTLDACQKTSGGIETFMYARNAGQTSSQTFYAPDDEAAQKSLKEANQETNEKWTNDLKVAAIEQLLSPK